MAQVLVVILANDKAEYFYWNGWTTKMLGSPSGKSIVSAARAFASSGDFMSLRHGRSGLLALIVDRERCAVDYPIMLRDRHVDTGASACIRQLDRLRHGVSIRRHDRWSQSAGPSHRNLDLVVADPAITRESVEAISWLGPSSRKTSASR
jgi:hypothetical protein